MLDGCGRLQVFWYVFLPLARTSILATGLFAFVLSYAEFLFALVLSGGAANRRLPVVMAALARNTDVSWGLLNASVFLAVLPTVALVAVVWRFVVEDLLQGGIEGAPGLRRSASARNLARTRPTPRRTRAEWSPPCRPKPGLGRPARRSARDPGNRGAERTTKVPEEVGRLPRRWQCGIAADCRFHVHKFRMAGRAEATSRTRTHDPFHRPPTGGTRRPAVPPGENR